MATPPPTSVSATTTAVFDITGMTCASCRGRVERALAAVDGVAKVEVNLATQQARVAFDASRTERAVLVAAVAGAGYGVAAPTSPDTVGTAGRSAAERDERATLRRKLIVAGVATVPLLVLGMSHGALPFADTLAGRIVQFALATLVLFGPGARFLRGAWAAATHRTADMSTLVALGGVSAWAWATVATLAMFGEGGGHAAPHAPFEAVGSIVTFALLGKLLEARARWRLGDAVRALHALAPAVAHRLAANGVESDVPAGTLRPGDVVRVRPGERVPSDGVVVTGESAVDEALLTGESVPVARGPGQRVVGGSLVTDGALQVRVDRTGAETALARIASAVETAQASRAPISRLADRVTAIFVPLVLAIGMATFGIWWALDPSTVGFAVAIERFVAVLVIACPCALALATPAAVAVGAGRGAELGVLFRDGAALEHASRVDTVVFDKTGTLTAGRASVAAIEPVAGATAEQLLAVAAGLEVGSEHPYARAIVAAARERGLALPDVGSFRAVPAMGVTARIDAAIVRAGKSSWLRDEGVDVAPAAIVEKALAARGLTPIVVAWQNRVLGVLAVADRARPEAAEVVRQLAAAGVRSAMATGDRRAVAEAIAREVGIDDVAAELLPADKVAHVESVRRQGRRVVMVGDGVNDAPALAAADVGMALGGGTDVAGAAADVLLVRGGLGAVPTAIALARATMRTIRRNLFWASAYNLLGLPLAAGAFAGLGLELSPVFASVAMSLSGVSVLVSSLRLRRFGAAPREVTP